MRTLMPCGTRAAYQRHKLKERRGNPEVCHDPDACRDAYNAYYRGYDKALPAAVRLRRALVEDARRTAMARLGQAHPERLAELTAELLPAKDGSRHLARQAARTRLAREHTDEYARLHAEERAKRGLDR